MIKEITAYTIICDRCGTDLMEHDEFIGYSDKQGTIETAENSEWQIIKDEETCTDKHSCPDCWEWDADEENIIFKPKTNTK